MYFKVNTILNNNNYFKKLNTKLKSSLKIIHNKKFSKIDILLNGMKKFKKNNKIYTNYKKNIIDEELKIIIYRDSVNINKI